VADGVGGSVGGRGGVGVWVIVGVRVGAEVTLGVGDRVGVAAAVAVAVGDRVIVTVGVGVEDSMAKLQPASSQAAPPASAKRFHRGLFFIVMV
jgi:hypothetical protein